MLKKLIGYFMRNKKKSGRKEVSVTNQEETMPESTDTFAVTEIRGQEVDYKCGHRQPSQYTFDLYGQKIELSPEGLEQRELCANCDLAELKKITIRCASCGFVIMPGHPVALYVDDPNIFKKRDWITKVEQSVIGCLRWGCCPSGGFFAGHWTGEKFQGAFAGTTLAGEALRNPGKMVVIKLDN